MSEVINGQAQMIFPDVCRCGVCVAFSIIQEEVTSYPSRNTCFRLNKKILCLVLDQLMQTTNDGIEEHSDTEMVA